jgi:S-DNA-T family DNA segregation ATPase FtsK/SpoIIIE
MTIQVAVTAATTADREVPARTSATPWHPGSGLTGFVTRRNPGSRAALAEWERCGAQVISLEEFTNDEWASAHRIVVTGDAEEWQRHWRALVAMRSDHDLIVDSTCAADFRLLTGQRGLPPYCEPGRARGWLLRAGGEPERIEMPVPRPDPGEHPPAERRDA